MNTVPASFAVHWSHSCQLKLTAPTPLHQTHTQTHLHSDWLAIDVCM